MGRSTDFPSTALPGWDLITAVDGHAVAGRTSHEVVAHGLAGAVGAPVKPTVRRPGRPDPLEITVGREVRPAP